jgi:hypothetical protein
MQDTRTEGRKFMNLHNHHAVVSEENDGLSPQTLDGSGLPWPPQA